eukprot:TRINITY_DN10022_c0_g1_i1.p3 TRINITY_DN10022_c0_g1~~TRINITY_DN10022_c0_g1_i1.p3  ORF type:complete len:208 (+),score=36.16 TRINITY_DN10022_c0_g1_i1:1317-1940(+)
MHIQVYQRGPRLTIQQLPEGPEAGETVETCDADYITGACDIIVAASLQSLYRTWPDMQGRNSTGEDLLQAADYKVIWQKAHGQFYESSSNVETADADEAVMSDGSADVADALMEAYADAEERIAATYDETSEGIATDVFGSQSSINAALEGSEVVPGATDGERGEAAGGDEGNGELNDSLPGVFVSWAIARAALSEVAKEFGVHEDE